MVRRCRMSYFDTKIYNKQNLKTQDRRELDYWEQAFLSAMENSADEMQFNMPAIPVLADIVNQTVAAFCESLKEKIGYTLQETAVGMIEGYEGEVDEVEDPETYIYNSDNAKEE
jgi:hypothetical protein